MRSIVPAAVSACLALALTVAAPAAQADVPGQSNKLTLWQNDGYQGQELSRYSYDGDLHNDKCSGCDPGPGGNFGDDASSFVNNTDDWWVLYVDKGRGRYGGDVFCVRPNSHDADLGNNGVTNLEDEISSVDRKDGSPNIPGCSDKGHTIGHDN